MTTKVGRTEARIMLVLCALIAAFGLMAAWFAGFPWWAALIFTVTTVMFMRRMLRRYLPVIRDRDWR